jgi:hypothetical protein
MTPAILTEFSLSFLQWQLLSPSSKLFAIPVQSSNHTSSLHRPTSNSSSTTNFPCLSPCLLFRVLLPPLFVTCNCFSYIAEGRTWAYSKHVSRDHYPGSLLARRSDLQKIHVTWSLSTVVTSLRTRKTQPPLLLRNLATDCLPRISSRELVYQPVA